MLAGIRLDVAQVPSGLVDQSKKQLTIIRSPKTISRGSWLRDASSEKVALPEEAIFVALTPLGAN